MESIWIKYNNEDYDYWRYNIEGTECSKSLFLFLETKINMLISKSRVRPFIRAAVGYNNGLYAHFKHGVTIYYNKNKTFGFNCFVGLSTSMLLREYKYNFGVKRVLYFNAGISFEFGGSAPFNK